MSIKERLELDKVSIISRYVSGESIKSIAESYECNGGTIWYFLDGYGKINRVRKHHKEDFINDVKRKFLEENISMHQIAKDIGVSITCIHNWLKSEGIKTSKFKKVNRIKTLDQEKIVKEYLSGGSTISIGKSYNVNCGTIHRVLTNRNIKLRENRKYTFDFDFFKKIDTEEKAYILGFWYADGNNRNQRDGIRIELTDLEILEKMKRVFKYTGEIKYKKPVNERCKPQYSLYLCSKDISHDLEKLGCPPNKTFKIKFPSPDIVPDSLIHHFLRGYFDGDGSFKVGKTNRPNNVSIIGTRNFVDGIVKLCDFAEFHYYQRHPKRNKDNWTIMITKKDGIRNFMNYIYKDATIYLQRKYDLYVKSVINGPPDVVYKQKVDYIDKIREMSPTTSIRKMCRELKLHKKTLIGWLKEEGLPTDKFKLVKGCKRCI